MDRQTYENLTVEARALRLEIEVEALRRLLDLVKTSMPIEARDLAEIAQRVTRPEV